MSFQLQVESKQITKVFLGNALPTPLALQTVIGGLAETENRVETLDISGETCLLLLLFLLFFLLLFN